VRVASQREVDLSQFRKVLKLDPETATVKVESGVTMRQLCAHTLSHGFIPSVVPSCGSVTVGGAISGIATGSSSFTHGFFHDCVVVSDFSWPLIVSRFGFHVITLQSVTLVTPDGKLITATDSNEHSGLFRALPGSCGTLGFIIGAALRVR
jgi:FAD/FMN-containing dehydrogenase